MDAHDIREEIEKDLSNGGYPFTRLVTTLESIYTLATDEHADDVENPAKQVIKTLKALQDTYFYDNGTSHARFINQKLNYGIDNITRRSLYTAKGSFTK